MPLDLTLLLSPKQASDPKLYLPIAARKVGIREEQIALARITRRSVDARSHSPKINLGLSLYIDGEQTPAPIHFDYPDIRTATPVVVVGAGPAGLFAALRLIELGYRPIVLERGKDVSSRKRDIAQINRNGTINPDSNYAFGEGGAGTYSDGKLYTRSKKRGDYRRILEILHYHGASEEILYDAHPHIGTDRLPRIITALRHTITDCGGQVVFNSRVTGFEIKGQRITSVHCGATQIEGAAVILATGHSARDIYEALQHDGVRLEAKAYAMGVRVEHPQALIDSIQYHKDERGPYLPAASYSLVQQVGGRGVYSFCMCPGGFIVPAMTVQSESVVNGMSPSGRNSIWANSGIVTEIRESDFAHLIPAYGPLAGMRFQQQFERLARECSGPYQIAPAQRLDDFVNGRVSASLPRTSYVPGVVSCDFGTWMPSFITETLRGGFRAFDRKMRGFLTHEAIIIGVESRTSSPVRIPRNPESGMHPEIEGLFPAGEGAGYAGGIVSAAIDGESAANKVASYLQNH